MIIADATISSTLLVLGGARSGKSRFAEAHIAACSMPRIYLATATAGDEEMHARIAHHRARRDADWLVVDEPLNLVEALQRHAARDRATLVDCLTLWLSNLMHAGRDPDRETQRLADWLQRAPGPLALVSNEVGLGLVPDTPLGRRFRDAQGRLNQQVASAVSEVVFIAAGLPLWLKGGAPPSSS